jgi:glycosyltransferase involved in cell wall biosynthesis
MARLIIHAPNIHHGGGAVLLKELMLCRDSAFFILDERMEIPAEVNINRILRVKGSVTGRLMAEIYLVRNIQPSDIVLCFGNLPPLFKLPGRVMVFLHNRYLLDRMISFSNFSWKVQLRLWIEKLWLGARRMNADIYFVQTQSMEHLAKQKLNLPVEHFAFAPNNLFDASLCSSQLSNSSYDFLYVASGEPHKNHAVLIEAWKILAKEGLYPSLALTLSQKDEEKLISKRELSENPHICNLGLLIHEEVLSCYKKVRALVYPSVFESFGLPLIEAQKLGLPIIASELDYVRDLVTPVESFDPSSPISLARAVKRFLLKKQSFEEVHDAAAFLARVKKGLSE